MAPDEAATASLSGDEYARFVSAVNADLAGAYTAAGIRRWWGRPRRALGGLSPLEALGGGFDPDSDIVHAIRQLAAYVVGPGDAT